MSAPASPLFVLLVEDDPGFSLLLSEYLDLVAQPCRVERVAALSDALTALRRERFDLVISDLSLPDSDAQCTIVSLLRATGAMGAGLLLTSGLPRDLLPAAGQRLGPADYVEKRHLDLAAVEMATDKAARMRGHG